MDVLRETVVKGYTEHPVYVAEHLFEWMLVVVSGGSLLNVSVHVWNHFTVTSTLQMGSSLLLEFLVVPNLTIAHGNTSLFQERLTRSSTRPVDRQTMEAHCNHGGAVVGAVHNELGVIGPSVLRLHEQLMQGVHITDVTTVQEYATHLCSRQLEWKKLG
jgi:hypothetical protein